MLIYWAVCLFISPYRAPIPSLSRVVMNYFHVLFTFLLFTVVINASYRQIRCIVENLFTVQSGRAWDKCTPMGQVDDVAQNPPRDQTWLGFLSLFFWQEERFFSLVIFFPQPSDVKLRAIVLLFIHLIDSRVVNLRWDIFPRLSVTNRNEWNNECKEECEPRQSISAWAHTYIRLYFRWRGVGGSCDMARHVYTLLSARFLSSHSSSKAFSGASRVDSFRRIRNKRQQ